MKLRCYALALPIRHVFRTSKVVRKGQPTLIVSLQEGAHVGYGECTENVFFGAKVADLMAEIKKLRPLLEGKAFADNPEAGYDKLAAMGLHPFALCAIDEAWHDLCGKQAGKPLYALWGWQKKALPTSYTIGIDSMARMQEKIREKPWPIYKIKVGQEDDIALVEALRKVTDAVFRVDANGAWTLEEALAKGKALQALGVELIEQPLPREAIEEQKQLYTHTVLPLIADESCQYEEDIPRCVGLFHGVNIKLTKCGGITPARRMIAAAQAAGLRTMMGCMVESSVGISALAQLVPALDYVDMDGALLLSEDPATGVQVHPQGVRYSDVPGTGAALKPQYL